MWYIHTMKYYLAIKRNEVLIHSMTWLNLKTLCYVKIPEHKDEAETTLWTTETKKDHIRSVKGVTTLTGLPLPQTGTGLHGEDSSRSLVYPRGKRNSKVNIQFPQHLWVTSQEPQLGLVSHGLSVCMSGMFCKS